MSDPDQRRRFFDPTINLGHVLTMLSMLAAGFGAYSQLDKRLAVQEERTSALARKQDEQASQIRDALGEMRADIKDVQRGVNALTRAVNEAPPRR